jgi:hypothetical protein
MIKTRKYAVAGPRALVVTFFAGVFFLGTSLGYQRQIPPVADVPIFLTGDYTLNADSTLSKESAEIKFDEKTFKQTIGSDEHKAEDRKITQVKFPGLRPLNCGVRCKINVFVSDGQYSFSIESNEQNGIRFAFNHQKYYKIADDTYRATEFKISAVELIGKKLYVCPSNTKCMIKISTDKK